MGNCASCKRKGKHEAGALEVPLSHDENAVPGAGDCRCKIPVGQKGEIVGCRCRSDGVAAVEARGEIVPGTESCRCKITGAAEGKGDNVVVAATEAESYGYRSLYVFLAEAAKSTHEQHKEDRLLQQDERAAAEAKDERSTATLPQVEITEQVEQQLETKEKPGEKVESEAQATVAADEPVTTVAHEATPAAEKVASTSASAEKFIAAVVEEAKAEKLRTVEKVAGPSLSAATPAAVLEQQEEERHVEKIEAAMADPVESVGESKTGDKVAEDVSETTVALKLIPELEKIAPRPAEKFTMALVEMSAAFAVPVERVESETTANVVVDVSETENAQKLIPDMEKTAPPPAEKFTAAIVEASDTEKPVPVDMVVEPCVAAATVTRVLEQPEEAQRVMKFESAFASENSAAIEDPVERVEFEATSTVAAEVSEITVAHKLIPEVEKVASKHSEMSTAAVEEEAETEKLVPMDKVAGSSHFAAATATPVLEQPKEEEHAKKFEAAAASEISSAVADPVERIESASIKKVVADVSDTRNAQKLISDMEKITPQPSEKFTIELVSVDTATQVLEQPEEAQQVEKFEAVADSETSSAVADPMQRVESEATAMAGADVSEYTAAQKLIPDLEKVAPKPRTIPVAEQTETEKLVTPSVASAAVMASVEQTEAKQHVEKFEAAAGTAAEVSAAVVDPVQKDGDETESRAGTITIGGESNLSL